MLLRIAELAFYGFLGGIAGGMGMGGGTLLIPLLTIFADMEQKQAQGTNLLAYIPAGLIALWAHKKAGRLDKAQSVTLCKWGIVGAIAGTGLAIFLKADLLKRLFGAFILAMAVYQFISGERNARKKGGK